MVTVRELYNSGDYNLVIKFIVKNRKLDNLYNKVKNELKRRQGKKIALGSLVAWLYNIIRPDDVRIVTSFAAIDWSDPGSWGRYSWPYKTSVSYNLDKKQGFYVIIGRQEDEEKLALLTLYKGFGVSLVKEQKTGISAKKEAVPIVVFIDEKLKQKPNVVFISYFNGENYKGHALVSDESIIPILQEAGFNGITEIQIPPGIVIYKTELIRTFQTRNELELFIKKLRDKLSMFNFLLFEHRSREESGLNKRKQMMYV